MNRRLAVLFLIFISINTFSIELSGDFSVGNLKFNNNRAADALDFAGNEFLWGLSGSMNQELSEELSVETSFAHDSIHRRISYTRLFYNQDFFEIGVGPFFGFFNSANQILNSGISTEVRIELPAVVYASFRADSTIGGRLVQTGDYIQEQSDVSFGFYVPNAICSANIHSRRFTQKTDAGEVVDSLTYYSFDTDIYQKNIPYRILLSFGYEQLDRTFVSSSISHTLGSVMLGTTITVEPMPVFSIELDLNSSVYTFGMNNLIDANPIEALYMFRSSIGFSLNIDALLETIEDSNSQENESAESGDDDEESGEDEIVFAD
ncbi:MAG: hypothetical protein ACLFR1_01535 [Spirochaetia bacterium]